jgi:hypothetical protein
MLKGAIPVALAYYVFDAVMAGRLPVTLAPIAGHAPALLGFHGGKAGDHVRRTALTVPLGPFLMGGSVFLFYKLLNLSGWAVMASLLILLSFLLLAGAELPVLVAWAGTVAILVWTHRADLRQRPALRWKSKGVDPR